MASSILETIVYYFTQYFLYPLGLTSPVYLQASPKSYLYDIVKRSCPSLYGEQAWYTPPIWLASGHLQTVFCAFANFNNVDQMKYQRVYLRTTDGGTVSLDFPHHTINKDTSSNPDINPPYDESNKPFLVVLHGLTGGSHESYVRSVLRRVTGDPKNGGMGWRAVVVNFRGCAQTPVTSRQLYNAGWTQDLKTALIYMSKHFPNAPCYGIGFSLGANALAKYLGQSSTDTGLHGGIVLGCPWDLYLSHLALSKAFLGNVYSKAMAKNLRVLFKRHIHLFKDDDRLNLEYLYGNDHATLYECDTLLVRALGNFKHTEDYYISQSAARFVEGISVPTLTINAIDDPIVSPVSAPDASKLSHNNLITAKTLHGGHLGWFTGFMSFVTKKRWVVDPVCEFLNAIHLEYVSNPDKMPKLKGPPQTKQKGEFIVDTQDESVGYYELPLSYQDEIISGKESNNDDMSRSSSSSDSLVAGL